METKQIINSLERRYAVKKFDNTKTLTSEQITFLKKIISLTPTSYGLEPYKVLIVKNQKLREQLKTVSWNQSQITDASHLIVFANAVKISEKDVDEFISLTAKTRNLNLDSLKSYRQMILGSISSNNNIANWTKNQAYIALGNTISALACAGIDSCPMEGLDANKYTQILGLDKLGFQVAVVLAVGFKAKDDAYATLKKVRKPESELFIEYS